MRNILSFIVLAVLTTASIAPAQTPRTIKRAVSIEDFRPVGDRRLWTFVARDSVLGNLISGVDSRTTIDGEPALVIKGGMRLDFRKIGGEQLTVVQIEHYVSANGRFLGDKMTFQVQERQEEFDFRRDGDKVTGYFTRNGQHVEQTVEWPRAYFAYDANFVDQLEILLATRDLTERAMIDDTIFVPQLLSTSHLAGQVGEVERKELWRGKFDSVIAVQFTEPQPMTAYMALDHRLVRVDFPGQNFRAYQDLVQRVAPDRSETAATTQLPGIITYTALAAHYLAYIVIAGLVLLFLAARAYKWSDAYFGLLFGGIVFGLVLVTQFPAQKYIVANLVIPELRQGGNLYLWGFLPALAGGIMQELLKLLGVYALVFHRRPPINRWTKLGVFVAGAFGLVEACYLATPTPIQSWQLFEGGARIAFHVSSGALLAMALASVSCRRYAIIGGLIVVDTLMIYLPVFVQQKVTSAEAMHFVLAAVAVVALVSALVTIAKFVPRPGIAPADTPPPVDVGGVKS
jgi:hypothetical protein